MTTHNTSVNPTPALVAGNATQQLWMKCREIPSQSKQLFAQQHRIKPRETSRSWAVTTSGRYSHIWTKREEAKAERTNYAEAKKCHLEWEENGEKSQGGCGGLKKAAERKRIASHSELELAEGRQRAARQEGKDDAEMSFSIVRS